MLDAFQSYLVAIVPCLTAVLTTITAVIVQIQNFKKSLKTQELTRTDEVKEVKNARKEMREIIKLNNIKIHNCLNHISSV